MNYRKHYRLLIQRGRNRELSCYFEKHHAKPKCLGGTDNKNNIVKLTAEEHYVAHQLLLKMYPNNNKLLYAITAMSNLNISGRRENNKLYGWIRRKVSENRKIRTPEHQAKLNIALKGRKFSEDAKIQISKSRKALGIRLIEEHKLKLSKAKKGKRFSKSHLENLSESHKGIKLSVETKTKMSLSHKGKIFSEEHKLNLSLAAKRRYAERGV